MASYTCLVVVCGRVIVRLRVGCVTLNSNFSDEVVFCFSTIFWRDP
jgi:hypothetical protein